jgi:hypothetical protein
MSLQLGYENVPPIDQKTEGNWGVKPQRRPSVRTRKLLEVRETSDDDTTSTLQCSVNRMADEQ